MASKEASDPDWSEVRLDRDRLAGLLEAHAPADWEERFRKEELLDIIAAGESIQMFVMAADIRESTMLMKEAIKFERFAYVMDKFVSSVRQGITRSGGWFDKFTGDGFLAYWIVQSGPKHEYDERFVQAAGNIAHTAQTLVDLFHRRVLEDFRANSRNLSGGVGLSMGARRRDRVPRTDRRRADDRRPARGRSGADGDGRDDARGDPGERLSG